MTWHQKVSFAFLIAAVPCRRSPRDRARAGSGRGSPIGAGQDPERGAAASCMAGATARTDGSLAGTWMATIDLAEDDTRRRVATSSD